MWGLFVLSLVLLTGPVPFALVPAADGACTGSGGVPALVGHRGAPRGAGEWAAPAVCFAQRAADEGCPACGSVASWIRDPLRVSGKHWCRLRGVGMAGAALAFSSLRGGGKKQKRRAKSMRHVLEDLAQTSLHNSGIQSTPLQGDGALKVSARAPCLGSRRFGQTAGEAGRQHLREQQHARWQWQLVNRRAQRQCRVVIDGSNVLKHGGGRAKVGNMVGLVAAVEDQLKVAQAEILVIIDHWVAKEVGKAALAQLQSADYTLRVARDYVSADVRIMQAAKAHHALVVTNDRYLHHCPWYAASTCEQAGPPHPQLDAEPSHLEGAVEQAAETAPGKAPWPVAPDEWLWTRQHAYRFSRLGAGAGAAQALPEEVQAQQPVAARPQPAWRLRPAEHFRQQKEGGALSSADAPHDMDELAHLDLARLSLENEVSAHGRGALRSGCALQTCDQEVTAGARGVHVTGGRC